jgi:hypothetical protein
MQTRSLTVLGDRIGLPLAPGTAVHLDGLEPAAFDGIATVAGPEEAQVTIARVEASFEPCAGGFEALFHAGSLELDDGAAAALSAKLATRPTILVVDLDRPAILRPHLEADVLIAAFGASDQAIVVGLFGRQQRTGCEVVGGLGYRPGARPHQVSMRSRYGGLAGIGPRGGYDHRRCRCRGGSLYPPGYPGDHPCPAKGTAIQGHNDQDQSMLQRSALGVRQERHSEDDLH